MSPHISMKALLWLAMLALVSALVVGGGPATTLARKSWPKPARTFPQSRAAPAIGVRIIFGESQSATRLYDGSLSISSGSLVRLVPYRFFQQDSIVGSNSWKLVLKRLQFDNRGGPPTSVAGGAAAQNIVPAGITATLLAPETASLKVHSAAGSFEFVLQDLPYGRLLRFLDDDVTVERVPAVEKISEGPEQHDYLSCLETRDGRLWFAWQAYKDREDRIYFRGENPGTLSHVETLAEERGDLLGTALGEDSRGTIHLVWAERHGEDWNLA